MHPIRLSRATRRIFGLLSLTVMIALAAAMPAFAQDEATPAAGDLDDTQPAPASIGTDIPLTYFGPPPSTFQKELVGPLRLIRAGELDQEAGTITLPLYRGQLADGTPIWYILTDTTDKGNADALGLNHSPKLAYAAVEGAVRDGTLEQDLSVTFNAGTVDFSPELTIEPGEGENAFPPTTAEPGSVGDEGYSPLVRIENAGGHIYNAPIVAAGVAAEQLDFCDGDVDHGLAHDKVLMICPETMTVTIELVPGFSFGRPVLYMSMDASEPMVAAIEGVTLAPSLANIRVGFDDGAFSAVERLFVTTNGPTGTDNPQRQGLNSALMKEGRGPLNVFGGVPTIALDYSPLWDLNLGMWTQEAVDAGYRARIIDEFQYLGLASQGHITSPDGSPFASSGAIVNCPIVFRFL